MLDFAHDFFFHWFPENLYFEILAILGSKYIVTVVSILKNKFKLVNIASLFQLSILCIQEETFTKGSTEGFWIAIIDVLISHLCTYHVRVFLSINYTR